MKLFGFCLSLLLTIMVALLLPATSNAHDTSAFVRQSPYQYAPPQSANPVQQPVYVRPRNYVNYGLAPLGTRQVYPGGVVEYTVPYTLPFSSTTTTIRQRNRARYRGLRVPTQNNLYQRTQQQGCFGAGGCTRQERTIISF